MKAQQEAREQLLRVVEVAALCSCSKASIWNWVKDPKKNFPKPAKLTSKVTVWKLSEINDYINNHIFTTA